MSETATLPSSGYPASGTADAPPRELSPAASRPLSYKERAAISQRIWQRLSFEPIGLEPAEPEAREAWRVDGLTRATLNFLGVTRTLDEHADEAVQPFPICPACAKEPAANDDWILLGTAPTHICVCRAHGRRHKPYFRVLTEAWHGSEILLDEKSRQILGTWWGVAVHVWLAVTRPGVLVGFQSDNQAKANELIGRAETIYRTLPRELQRFGPMSDSVKARARKIESEIIFRHVDANGRPVASRILAIPSGPNHVRMWTFTALLMDECQHWEKDADFEDGYAAALPTVKGGGKLVAISSVGKPDSYHHRLCEGLIS